MSGTALEAILRRDRAIVGTALVVLTAIAWAYLLWLAGSMEMDGMAMPDADMGGMAMPNTNASGAGSVIAPDLRAWTAAEFAFMFSMWAVMMVGMMTPSAAPMILIYARVGRHAAEQGKSLAATGFFVSGYLLAWTAFSLVATFSQWGLESLLLLTPAMASASGVFSSLVLIAAGLYQWTPQKEVCLRNCQAPLQFLLQHGGFRRDTLGSLSLGLRHGLYCIGCCWALMALLFVGGVMNIMWIAAIAIFVLAEKILLPGTMFSRIAGTLLLAWGGWQLGIFLL